MLFVSLALASISQLALQATMNDQVLAGDTTFKVTASIAVPDAPHGICFSPDGRLAYVACAGADKIAVLDCTSNTLVGELDAQAVPLDVILAQSGDALIATQFRSDALLRVPLDGSGSAVHETLQRAPSLFSPPTNDGRRFVVCEEANVVYEVGPDDATRRSWTTADRPYPADVTKDGILVFVPARDASAVTVTDTLNNRIAARVPVAQRPQGGAMTTDDVNYIVACGGSNELNYINTASFEVVATVNEGVGPRPFAVTLTLDGRFGIVNNAGGDTVSILDVAQRRIVGNLTVGRMPIVVRAHPDGQRIYVASEGNHTISVINIQREQESYAANTKTEVVVLGMIHSGHRTSKRYSLDVVKDLVRQIKPDYICAEIPPNRIDAAMGQFRRDGVITESRVKVFPEYVDAIFPLLNEMDFQIIATAGWTAEMNDYRRRRLREISNDPARASQWQEHQAATKRMNETIAAMDGDDNPRAIHTDEYDAIVDEGLRGPYNTYFNDDLADGGWDNINAKHYALIAKHLDSIRGQGKRVLVTFGAGHKGWFLRELRRRDDVTLLEVGPFLDESQASQ